MQWREGKLMCCVYKKQDGEDRKRGNWEKDINCTIWEWIIGGSNRDCTEPGDEGESHTGEQRI